MIGVLLIFAGIVVYLFLVYRCVKGLDERDFLIPPTTRNYDYLLEEEIER